MNAASWVILAIVAVVVGLAIKATFFRKEKRGGCCDVGDAKPSGKAPASGCAACSKSGGCAGCTACDGFAARNALQPTIREI